jgi:hypothetical protein
VPLEGCRSGLEEGGKKQSPHCCCKEAVEGEAEANDGKFASDFGFVGFNAIAAISQKTGSADTSGLHRCFTAYAQMVLLRRGRHIWAGRVLLG